MSPTALSPSVPSFLSSCPTANFSSFYFQKKRQFLPSSSSSCRRRDPGVRPAGANSIKKSAPTSLASSGPELLAAPPLEKLGKKLHCRKAAGVRWCVVVVVRASQRRGEEAGQGTIHIHPPTNLLLFPFFPPPSHIPSPLPHSRRAAARQPEGEFLLDPRSPPVRKYVPAEGDSHLPLRHHRRLLPPPEPQRRTGPVPGRRRHRRRGGRRRGVAQGRRAAPLQGRFRCEDRILDDGGHGKWAVPLEDPCRTTGEICIREGPVTKQHHLFQIRVIGVPRMG